jgi:uncharacterized protein (UPF0335 family)
MSDQLALPFDVDEKALGEYLTRALAIDNEQDRLRQELQNLKQVYVDLLPLGALSTAIAVVMKRKRRAEHSREPMSYEHQEKLEALVMAQIERLEEETRSIPDMVGNGLDDNDNDRRR